MTAVEKGAAAESIEGPRPWWGDFSVPLEETLRWEVGPLTFWVRRAKREWRIAYERLTDPFISALAAEVISEEPPESASQLRVGFRGTKARLQVQPALPDRPLVAKPQVPLFLPPGESATVFISSPLWVRLLAGEPMKAMHEMSSFVPSDTWFGPPNQEGTSCYAVRSKVRMSIENLPPLPHRAISVVHVTNRAESELAIERMQLPVPNLSLFAGADGHLWTEAVRFEREEVGELAMMKIDKGAPKEISRARLLQGPRVKVEKTLLLRAFSELFS